MTRNFYKENRYPRWAIIDFNRKQDYTGQFPRVSEREVASDPEFAAITPGPIDILYRFFSDEKVAIMALAFRLDKETGDYELLSIDPSLQDAWEKMMDQEREDW